MELFSNLNRFLNDEQSIRVLSVLVVLMSLFWILSGGFSFLRKKPEKDDKDGMGKK